MVAEGKDVEEVVTEKEIVEGARTATLIHLIAQSKSFVCSLIKSLYERRVRLTESIPEEANCCFKGNQELD